MWTCKECEKQNDDNVEECSYCGKQENLTNTKEYEYVGFWKRFIATILDFLIFIPVTYYPQMYVYLYSYQSRNILPQIMLTILIIFLCTLFIVKWGGTPGKLILKIRIKDNEGKNLSVYRALLRQSIGILLCIFTLLQMNNTINYISINEIPTNVQDIAKLNIKYSSGYKIIFSFISILYFIDPITIVFNKRKRAIHDYLAKSFVIKKI